MKIEISVTIAPANPDAPVVTREQAVNLGKQTIDDFVESVERGDLPPTVISVLINGAEIVIREALLEAAALEKPNR